MNIKQPKIKYYLLLLRVSAIQMIGYILNRRITILLKQLIEAAEIKIPSLLKASLCWL